MESSEWDSVVELFFNNTTTMFFWAKRSYYEITAFSQLVSVSNCVSSKMALCLKSYQKTGSLKVKKLIQPDISGKISFRKKTLKIPPKLYFTDVCLVSFKWCNMVFFIILQKPHGWKKSGFQVIVQNIPDQSGYRFF